MADEPAAAEQPAEAPPPEVPEAEIQIQDPENPDTSKMVKASEFDPAKHTSWADRDNDRGTTKPNPPGQGAPPVGAVDTMEIVNPKTGHGKLTINAADYKPDEHTVWEERKEGQARGQAKKGQAHQHEGDEPEQPKPEEPAPAEPSPDEPHVEHRSTRRR